jgi:hypothetical protein
MRRIRQCLPLLVVAGFGLWLAGCGGGVRYHKYEETGATLEGTVTYGDQKLEVAMVIVQGQNGSATAFIGEDGRYKATNVPLGAVNLAVNTDAGKGEMQGKFMAQSQGKGGGTLPKVIDVPAKYANPTTSGITTTINKGANTYDIVIKK